MCVCVYVCVCVCVSVCVCVCVCVHVHAHFYEPTTYAICVLSNIYVITIISVYFVLCDINCTIESN